MDLIITILPVVTITKDLPTSPRFTPYNFLSRCKFSKSTRQPMVELYLLTFPRFPLRKKEHKSYFGKNRTHDFHTTSRCAGYLLDHSGDELQRIIRWADGSNHLSLQSVNIFFVSHLRPMGLNVQVYQSHLQLLSNVATLPVVVVIYYMLGRRFKSPLPSLCQQIFCISFTTDGSQRARLPFPPAATATLPCCLLLWSLRIIPSPRGSRLRFFIAMQVQHPCMVTHIARVWINRVRLPILHVVNRTEKINISLSAFAPENLLSRDGFGSPVPRRPAHLHTQAE